MFYKIKPEVAYCVIGKSVIFLDVEIGRYFRLPQTTADALIRLISRHGELAPEDEPYVGNLMTTGQLVPVHGPTSMAFAAEIEHARNEFKSSSKDRVSIFYFALTIWLQLVTVARLQFHDFAAVLKRLQLPARSRNSRNINHDSRAHRLASAFDRSDRLLGRTDRCLVRSIAMMSACRLVGTSAQFVIGVRSEPFVAHCWVQSGETVLNDTVEHVRTFTPILVVR